MDLVRSVLGRFGVFWYIFNLLIFIQMAHGVLSYTGLHRAFFGFNLLITTLLLILTTKAIWHRRSHPEIKLRKTLSFQVLGLAGMLYIALLLFVGLVLSYEGAA